MTAVVYILSFVFVLGYIENPAAESEVSLRHEVSSVHGLWPPALLISFRFHGG